MPSTSQQSQSMRLFGEPEAPGAPVAMDLVAAKEPKPRHKCPSSFTSTAENSFPWHHGRSYVQPIPCTGPLCQLCGHEEEAELLSQTPCALSTPGQQMELCINSPACLSQKHTPLTDPNLGQSVWHSSNPRPGLRSTLGTTQDMDQYKRKPCLD